MKKLLVSVIAASLFVAGALADSFPMNITNASMTSTATVERSALRVSGYVDAVYVYMRSAAMTCDVQLVTGTNIYGDLAVSILDVSAVSASTVYRPRLPVHDSTGVVQPLFTNGADRIWLDNQYLQFKALNAKGTNKNVSIRVILVED